MNYNIDNDKGGTQKDRLKNKEVDEAFQLSDDITRLCQEKMRYWHSQYLGLHRSNNSGKCLNKKVWKEKLILPLIVRSR